MFLTNIPVDIEKLEGKIISYKSLFIEWCQKNKKQRIYLHVRILLI